MKKAADFKVEADIERSRRASLQILKRRMSNLVLQTQISTAGIQQSPTLKIGARSPSISHDQELPYSPNIRKQPSQSISSFSESPSPARKNPQKSPTKIREGKSSKGNETSKSFLDIIEKDGNKSALDIYSYYGVSVHDKENKSVLESRTPLTQLEKMNLDSDTIIMKELFAVITKSTREQRLEKAARHLNDAIHLRNPRHDIECRLISSILTS